MVECLRTRRSNHFGLGGRIGRNTHKVCGGPKSCWLKSRITGSACKEIDPTIARASTERQISLIPTVPDSYSLLAAIRLPLPMSRAIFQEPLCWRVTMNRQYPSSSIGCRRPHRLERVASLLQIICSDDESGGDSQICEVHIYACSREAARDIAQDAWSILNIQYSRI